MTTQLLKGYEEVEGTLSPVCELTSIPIISMKKKSPLFVGFLKLLLILA